MTMLHACNNYYYGMLVCSVLYYPVTVVSLFFLGNINFFFYCNCTTIELIFFVSLFSSSINSCDLNHSREIVNWANNLIPSIKKKKNYSSI